MQTENFLIIFILSIIVPILYIKFVSGFTQSMSDKLVNANFELNIVKSTHLVFGYGVCSLLFSYIFHQFFKYGLLESDKIVNIGITMPFLALSFCYLARVMTRKNGRFSGRLYLNGVTAIASLLFFINTAIGLSPLVNTPVGLDHQIVVMLQHFDTSLLQRIELSVIFIKDWMFSLLLGSLLMALVGEFVILKFVEPNVRSIHAVLDKFPSDFKVVTGNNKIKKKMENMTSQSEVHSVKCITNTYKAFEIIHSNMEDQWRQISNSDGTPPDYRIIGPSEQDIQKHFRETYFRNFGKIIETMGLIYKCVLPSSHEMFLEKHGIGEIGNRMSKLNRMSNEGRIRHIETDFGRFRMLMVNDSEVLFTVTGGGAEKIGIYTKEKYIVQLCMKLFEDSWKHH